jgi:hypothetical protein
MKSQSLKAGLGKAQTYKMKGEAKTYCGPSRQSINENQSD